MVWESGDQDFQAIRDAYLNGTVLDMVILDGPYDQSGSQGLRADFGVTKFTRNEPLEEGVTVSVTLKPSYSANNPTWFTAA